MKLFNLLTLSMIILFAAASCKHILPPKETGNDINDTIVSENFTGLKKYYSEGKLIKEVTFKNGAKDGLCKNYYDDGRLKTTIIYSNNLKSDTSRWYYPEGMVYRATPYRNNMLDGVQVKYYKNGRVQAEIPYKNGLRTPGLKEYYEDGRAVSGMPSIVSEIDDSYYSTHGTVRLVLKLSNNSVNVQFFRGPLVDGAFDPLACKEITVSSGMGYIELARAESGGTGYIDITAVYITRFKNKEILTKRVKLPYNNLK
ncbi:MAG: toxin-antitoxin system YwqK family antitoxin [Bacteroidales bacterium]